LAVKAVEATMQGVRSVVGGELHLRAIEHKARIGNPVGVAADGRAKKAPFRQIPRQIVIAEHDVVAGTTRVGSYQRLQGRAKGDDAGLESFRAAQHHALDRAAIGQCAEQFLRKVRRIGHAQSSKASTMRRLPSRNASATRRSGVRSTSPAPVAVSSRKRRYSARYSAFFPSAF